VAVVGVGSEAVRLGLAVKVAVHILFADMITCQLALQSPLQPEKVDEAFGVAVAVTEAHEV